MIQWEHETDCDSDFALITQKFLTNNAYLMLRNKILAFLLFSFFILPQCQRSIYRNLSNIYGGTLCKNS